MNGTWVVRGWYMNGTRSRSQNGKKGSHENHSNNTFLFKSVLSVGLGLAGSSKEGSVDDEGAEDMILADLCSGSLGLLDRDAKKLVRVHPKVNAQFAICI